VPTRDRNHELETESQRAFESALPADLVVRPISDDYGVDREVEVFVDGKTTGLIFKVQLKGTDKSGKTRRIKREHLDYWTALPLPVLLVSYEAPTGTLRGRWVHSIGADNPDTGAATVTVYMDPDIDIGGTWPQRLASDLALIRTVRAGDLPKPLPVRLVVDEALDLSASQVMASLLNASRRTGHPMRKPIDDDEAALLLTVAPTRIQAALPLQIATATTHLTPELLGTDPRTIGERGLVLAAAAVAAVNTAIARTWLKGGNPEAPWWGEPAFAGRLVQILDSDDSVGTLLDIHANLVERDHPGADLYSMSLLEHVHAADGDTFDQYSTRVQAALPDDTEGGRLAFNLAHLHKGRRDFGTALDLLETAARLSPKYLNDPLYLRHIGSVAWELERYEESATHYKRALDLGYDAHEMLPLIADSLMYAGRYGDAREALEGWQRNGGPGDKAGVLRRVILDNLVTLLDLTEQDRSGYDLEQMTARYEQLNESGNRDAAALIDLLRDFDALQPSPWKMLVNLDDPAGSFEASLTAALIEQTNPTLWLLTLLCCLARGCDEHVVTAVVDQARYLCPSAFYDEVSAFAELQEPTEAHFLRELISNAYASEPETMNAHYRVVDFEAAAWVLD
jgi:tetratricopeptide (TPR) repeat protein